MRRLPWVPTDSTVLGHHRFAAAGESTCARWPRPPK